MNDKKTSVRTLTMLALLVAMSIVFSRVLSISTGFVRFNLGLVAGFAWQKLNRLSTNLRLAASVLLGHFVGSMVINLLALRLFYGYPWATLAVRIPNALILSAVNVVLLRILLENRSLMKLAKK